MSGLKQQIEKKAKTHVKSVHGGIAIDLGAKYVLVSDVFDSLANYDIFPKGKESVSLKQLEEAIKNQPSPVSGALGYVFDGDDVDAYCKRIEVAFAKCKKQCVCIPKNKLEELWKKLPMLSMGSIDTHYDAREHIHKTADWVKKLEKLLGKEKTK